MKRRTRRRPQLAVLLPLLLTLAAGPGWSVSPCAADDLFVRGRVDLAADVGDAGIENGATVELRPIESLYAVALRALGTGEDAAPEPAEPEPVASAWATAGEDGRWQVSAPPGVYSLRITSGSRRSLNHGAPDHGAPDRGAPDRGVPDHEYTPVLLTADVYPRPFEPPDADRLRITVSSENGPVAGALVRVDPVRTRPFHWHPATQWLRTGADGKADFAVDAGQRLRVSVAADGLGPFTEIVAADLQLELPSAKPRTVRVEDRSGAAVAGAVLLAHEVPVARTDTEGLATVHVAADGVRLTALAPDGGFGTTRIEPPSESARQEDHREPRVLTLVDRRVVSGRVVDAETRRPLAEALVWRSSRDTDADHFTLTDGAGAYELPLPMGAPVKVEAQAANHFRSSVEVRRGDHVAPTLALAPAASLAGTVVNALGEPVEDAEVSATFKPEGRIVRFRGGGVLDARTDASGRFRVRGLDPGGAYELEARAEGYAPGKTQSRAPRLDDPSPAASAQPVEIVLTRGVQAFGRVVDETDQPIAGATVQLEAQGSNNPMDRLRRTMQGGAPDAEAQSDADGIFSFRHVAAGSYRMSASAPGFGPAAVPGIELVAGETETDLGTLVLSPGVTVHGLVVDSEGVGLAGAQVRIFQRQGGAGLMRIFTMPTGPADATSGADGRFEIVDLAEGEQLALQASLTGYQSGSVEGVRTPNEEPARIVLQESAEVRGRVVDDAGLPVEGAEIGLGTSQNMGPFSRMRQVGSATSDADGRFELLDAPPGAVQLTAEADGFQEATRSLELSEGQQLDDMEITLRPGARVLGTVTDSDGMPVVDAAVAVESDDAGGNSMLAMIRGRGVKTDGDGNFLLDGLETGRKTIVATKDALRTSRVLDVKVGTNRLDLRFSTGAPVSGRVVDADGLPASDVQLTLQGTEEFTLRFTTASRADGSFRFDDVAPGTYRLVGEASGMATTSPPDPVVVAADPVSGLELRMQRGQMVTGRLLGAEFDDLANVQIFASRESSFVMGEATYEGDYRVEGLGAGRWTVRAALGDGRRATETVDIEEGVPETVLDLDFEEGESLMVEVVSESAPAQGVNVMARGLDVGGGVFGETNTEGRFEFHGLHAGRHRITAMDRRKGLTAEQVVDVPGPEVRLELVAVGIEGRVTDGWDGSELPGATVRAEPARSEPSETFWFLFRGRSVDTDDTGRFRLGGLTLGTWNLEVSKTGYAAKTQPVEVFGDGTSVEIVLEPSDGMWMTVRRTDGAAPSKVQLVVHDAAGRRVAGGDFVPDDQGRVYVSTVPPGQLRLVVQAPGTAPTELDVRVPDERPQVVLAPGAQVEVEVPELATDPARTEAVFLGAGGQLRTLTFGAQLRDRYPMSGGRTTVNGVPAGTWTVTVTAPDGRSWSGQVEVSGSGRSTVRLE